MFAQLALENIATSDAAYRDVNHTIMVTLVGQQILRGRHISVGGVTSHDRLHFIISLLAHDIGYVRGICRGDGDGSYVINLAGGKVTLPEGATDASMAPYHVARSKLFVRERAAKARLIHLDTAQIEANIPVLRMSNTSPLTIFPGLVRAADLIGQLADINYLRKQTALYDEFRETGTSDTLGYSSVADLRANYPDFFWKTVRPYMGDALRAPALTEARAICDFLLEAACEATTWAAVLNAQRGPRSSASRNPFPSVTSVVATLCRRWVI